MCLYMHVAVFQISGYSSEHMQANECMYVYHKEGLCSRKKKLTFNNILLPNMGLSFKHLKVLSGIYVHTSLSVIIMSPLDMHVHIYVCMYTHTCVCTHIYIYVPMFGEFESR